VLQWRLRSPSGELAVTVSTGRHCCPHHTTLAVGSSGARGVPRASRRVASAPCAHADETTASCTAHEQCPPRHAMGNGRPCPFAPGRESRKDATPRRARTGHRSRAAGSSSSRAAPRRALLTAHACIPSGLVTSASSWTPKPRAERRENGVCAHACAQARRIRGVSGPIRLMELTAAYSSQL
jgi:hypothetical protein